MSYQQITIVGRLGHDPKTRKVGDSEVCMFSVAVNDYKGNHPTWFKVSAWEGLGTTCQKYLQKGRQVLVTGKVRARLYEVRGEPHASLDLRANNVQFLARDASVPDPLSYSDEQQHGSTS